MKKIILAIALFSLFSSQSFSQMKFSEETQKYIEYNDAVFVLKDALLIDGKGNPAKPHQTVVVSGGKIQWIGDDAKAVVPNEAKIIELAGKAVMPGLVMTHEHMYISATSRNPRYPNLKQLAVTFPRLYLAAGATTIRTCGSIEPYSDLRLKKDIDLGIIPGPSMEITAPYIDGKNSIFPQMKEAKSPADATAFVNYWADQGFTSFKAYTSIDKPTLKAVIEAAHKRNLKVTGHLNAVTSREAAELGIDRIEHGFLESTDFVKGKKENEAPNTADTDKSLAELNVEGDAAKSLIRFLIDKKVGITSTLAVFEGFTTTQPLPSADLLDVFSPDARDYYLKNFPRFKSGLVEPDMDKAFLKNAKMEKMFYEMGGLLTVGSDPTGIGGTLAGYGDWRAIELLVEADGFTPLEAIKIATLNGALALGFEKTVGTIEKGKSADLLIIEGDPSKNISDLRKVQFVFKNGVGYNSKKLFESVKGKVGFY